MGAGCSRPKSTNRSGLFPKLRKEKSENMPSLPPTIAPTPPRETEAYHLIRELAQQNAVINMTTSNFAEVEQVDYLLQQLESIQECPFPLNRELTRQQAIPYFLTWCQQNNITYDGVELKHKSDVGLGLFASRRLATEEEVIYVPKDIMINSADCNDSIGYLIPEGHLDSWKMLPMALQMIIDRKERICDYMPYIDIMPHHFVHPHFFQVADFEMLQGSLVYQRCVDRWLWLVNVYCVIYLHILDLTEQGRELPITADDLTYDAFRWGFSIAATRTVVSQHDDDGSEGSVALVPMWDMCNNGVQTMKTYSKKGDSCAWTLRPHQAGEQLFIEYNHHANTKTHFGLWGICCPNDTLCPVTMTLNEKSPGYDKKLKTLQDLNLGTSRDLTICKQGEVPLSDDDLKFLIIIHLGDNDANWPYDPYLEVPTWMKAVLFLSYHLDAMLTDYKLKLAECHQLLKKNAKNVRPRTSLVLTQLIKEQEIITAVRDKLRILAYKSSTEITRLVKLGIKDITMANGDQLVECAA